MSRSPAATVVTLMALNVLLALPIASQTSSVADLLLNDEVEQAESQLNSGPKTAANVAFRGEIEYRKGHFDVAESLYRGSLKTDSKNARAHFGLGKLAMARVKTKTAIEEFTRAIDLDPKEPLYHLYASEAWGIDKNNAEQRKHLEQYLRLGPKDEDKVNEAKASLEILKAFGSAEVGVVEAPSPAMIRFQRSLNLIFLKATINGRGPYQFAIDTGATQSVISEKVANELGLAPITSTVVFGVGGSGKVDAKIYRVRELAIDDIKVKNIPVGTFNDPLISQVADGILATSTFSDFIVTIDYPAGRLVLSDRRKGIANPGAAGASGETLPVWFFSNLLLLPLEANGKRGNFIVDTGAVTTVLSHTMAAELGVNENTPGAKIDLGIAGVGGFQGLVLKIPDVTFKTPKNSEAFPQVVAIDLKQISKTLGTEVSGVAGYDFLSDYKVSLDYAAGEIRLAK